MIFDDPHPVWRALQAHALKSLPEYVALFALFMVAVIANMPFPDVIDKWLGAFDKFNSSPRQKLIDFLAIWYKWLYDSLQAFMSSRTPKSPPPPQEPPKV